MKALEFPAILPLLLFISGQWSVSVNGQSPNFHSKLKLSSLYCRLLCSLSVSTLTFPLPGREGLEPPDWRRVRPFPERYGKLPSERDLRLNPVLRVLCPLRRPLHPTLVEPHFNAGFLRDGTPGQGKRGWKTHHSGWDQTSSSRNELHVIIAILENI